MPSYISTFSTPIFNHTSLNILNILLKSLCPSPSLAVPFRTSVYMLLCCTFPFVGCTASPPSSTTLFFFLFYILGIRFLFFPILTPFLQLYPFFHTLHTLLLSSFFFLLLFLSSSMLLGIGCTIYFLLVSQEKILVSDFCGSISSCLYILYSPHTLPPFLL